MNYKFIQNVQIDWTRVGDYSYIRNIPALQFEDVLVFEKNITFFVGENGTGKSTLLEALDEPEAALSPQRQLTLMIEIQ